MPDPNPPSPLSGNPPAHPAPAGVQFPFLGPPTRTGDLGTLAHYRITKLVGEGGMGFVFRGEDDRLQRPVALKVMRPEIAARPLAKGRFLREGRAAAKVRSDHVVTIYDVGEANGVPFLAMEYLDGWTLEDWLAGQNGSAPSAAAIRIARDALRGLAAAHVAGLVHRDVKPANLWVEEPGEKVKVLDFGLTRGTDGGDQVTADGAVVGTPSYMAPEQAEGRAVDARADLFSLGAVLYRVLSGHGPFSRGSTAATIAAVCLEDPPPLADAGKGVPADLSAYVARLLAKDPAARPADARAALAELAVIERRLQRASAEPTVTLAGPARPRRRRSPRRWSPAVLVGAGLLGLALAAVAVVIVIISVTDKNGAKVEVTRDTKSDTKSDTKNDTKTVTGVPPAPVELPATFTNSLGMRFVKVGKGPAWLGGAGGKVGRPKVEMLFDYYIGKYEVTQDEWEKVTDQNPSYYCRTGPGRREVKDLPDADIKRLPVESVTWNDCQAFLGRLNEKAADPGWVYRLPTGDEWEYACRDGHLGTQKDSAFDFYLDRPSSNLAAGQANFGDPGGMPKTVGSYRSNRLGIHDMHGNVSEWCHEGGAPKGLPNDGTYKAVVGGNWRDTPIYLRASNRFVFPQASTNSHHGFRLVRVQAAAGNP